jgi:tetratricopeptide (TPR) repeat protein
VRSYPGQSQTQAAESFNTNILDAEAFDIYNAQLKEKYIYEYELKLKSELAETERLIAYYTESINLNSDNAYSFAMRGLNYLKRNRYDTAIKDLTEAIRLIPTYNYAYSLRGEAYLSTGQYNAAVKDFSEIIRLDPDNASAYGGLGRAYKQLGLKDQAIRDLGKSLSLYWADNYFAWEDCLNPRKPDPEWLGLVSAAYWELKEN